MINFSIARARAIFASAIFVLTMGMAAEVRAQPNFPSFVELRGTATNPKSNMVTLRVAWERQSGITLRGMNPYEARWRMINPLGPWQPSVNGLAGVGEIIGGNSGQSCNAFQDLFATPCRQFTFQVRADATYQAQLRHYNSSQVSSAWSPVEAPFTQKTFGTGLGTAAIKPEPPTEVAAAATDDATEIALSWTASTTASVSDYRVRWRTSATVTPVAAAGEWQGWANNNYAIGNTNNGISTGGAPTTAYTLTGLTGGVEYDVQVAAMDSKMFGDWTDAVFAVVDNSGDATLAAGGLGINDGAGDLVLTKTGDLSTDGFDGGHETYSIADVASGIASLTIRAARNIPGASVSAGIDTNTADSTAAALTAIIAADATENSNTTTLAVDVGENQAVVIVVTAADAATTKTYTVAFTRNPDTRLRELEVSTFSITTIIFSLFNDDIAHPSGDGPHAFAVSVPAFTGSVNSSGNRGNLLSIPFVYASNLRNHRLASAMVQHNPTDASARDETDDWNDDDNTPFAIDTESTRITLVSEGAFGSEPTQTYTLTLTRNTAAAPAVTAAAGDGSVAFSWAEIAAADSYQIAWRMQNTATPNTWSGGDCGSATDATPLNSAACGVATSAATSHTLTGLTNGAVYEYALRAGFDAERSTTPQQASGFTAWSAVATATPLAEINFAAATSTQAEDAGSVSVNVSTAAAVAADLSVAFTIGGTATGDDYSALASPVTIPSGQQTAAITFAITDDTADDDDETIILTLTAGGGYSIGATNTHTLTITDNDDLPVAPANLATSAVFGRSFVASWDAVGDATSYLIRWRIKDAGGGSPGDWLSGASVADADCPGGDSCGEEISATTYKITGTLDTTLYEVQVRAKSAVGLSGWTTAAEVTTITASADANVSAISVSGGGDAQQIIGPQPLIAADVTDYLFGVATGTAGNNYDISITPTVHAAAVVTGNDATLSVAQGVAGRVNRTFSVTSEDGTNTKSYSVGIGIAPAAFSDVTITTDFDAAMPLAPVWDARNFFYTAGSDDMTSIPGSVNGLKIHATWSGDGGSGCCDLILNGGDTNLQIAKTGAADARALSPLVTGTNTITMNFADGGKDPLLYTFAIVRETLLKPVAVAPPTAGAVTTGGFTVNWTQVTGASAYHVRWRLTDADGNGTPGDWMKAGGVADADGEALGNVDEYAITGLAQNTAYHYEVRASNSAGMSDWTQAAAAQTTSSSRLIGLTVDTADESLLIQAEFAAETTSYHVGEVKAAVSQLQITAATQDTTADISGVTLNGAALTRPAGQFGFNGAEFSVDISAATQDASTVSKIIITVTATDGVSTEYTVTFTREQHSVNLLSAIEVADDSMIYPLTKTGTLTTEGFDADHLTYETPPVEFGIAAVTFTATLDAASVGATLSISVRENAAADGVIAVQADDNIVTLSVTAQDGSVREYVVNVFGKPDPTLSDNNNLASLAVSVPLDQVFSADELEYTAGVEFATETIIFTPSVAEVGVASVTVNGVSVASGEASDPIPLTIGRDTTIEIVVTAGNGIKQTYIVKVRRDRDPSLPAAVDVNDDAAADSADGLLIARYLLGLRGEDLTDAAAVATIEARLKAEADAGTFNIDGDADTTAADAILIARYYLGVNEGAHLTAGQSDTPPADIAAEIKLLENTAPTMPVSAP